METFLIKTVQLLLSLSIIDGQRTNEPAAQTVGISVETGMAKAPNYGSGRCI